MEQDIRAFLTDHVAQVQPLLRNMRQANWNLATTGEQRYATELQQNKEALMALLGQPEPWSRVKQWYTQRAAINDDQVRRQLEVAYYQYASNQHSPEQITRIAELETELRALYSTFRATLDGQKVSDNDLKHILATDQDSARRQAAWEASKQSGVVAGPKVRELANLRNADARQLGWSDYYRMALDLQEIDEDDLFGLLDDLEQQTRAPFLDVKQRIDHALSERFGVAVADLRPWHYSDPFFQKAPAIGSVNPNEVYAEQDFADLTLRTFDGLGLDVRAILANSDLYERPNKHQHAFCIHIDPLGDDVRVLANLRHTAESMDTCLHEFGHAIYDYYLHSDLPFLLRMPAHSSTTEAIAMLMGRLARSTTWLEQVRGLPAAKAQDWAARVGELERIKQLIFIRWGLVMVHFERDLYRTETDLNSRWWDYVERFQAAPRPEGRDAPDWAAKLHLAIAPVYYHNYILGELTASQICSAIRTNTSDQRPGVAALVHNAAAGAFLRDRLFALGASLPWNETLAQVTGEQLNPRYFVTDFVRPIG